jgi:glycosyltransferase involved in cell wall biosynthesis
MDMRVAFLPVYANPYQRLLAGGLARAGVAVTLLPGLPSAAWLRANRATTDVLHFHWLYGLYMAHWRTPGQAAAFLRRFRLARRLGYRIVWTAHNVMPHRAAGLGPLHRHVRRLMMAEADAVITHCAAGRSELLAQFPRRGPTEVIPIGSYANLYPGTADRATARARLGLDGAAFVSLTLGNIAAYKGLERFAAVFSATAAADDVALIAGRDRDAGVVRRLRRAAAADGRIRLHAGYVPDDEVQLYLAAADALVAPFERILTSSSVVVGLSYGLPVVAPALGCMAEQIGAAGIVYPAGDAGLARALADIKRADRARMSAAARAIAAELDWDDIGRRTAAVYRVAVESGQ